MASFTGDSEDNIKSGTALSDDFDYSQGGNDTLFGDDGDDTFDMGSALTADDAIDGGTGVDTVFVTGIFNEIFNATTITNVENLVLLGDGGFGLTMDDGNVAAGQILTVDGTQSFGFNFDGVNELDGAFIVDGSDETDTIRGGHGNDILSGNGGDDYLYGGPGTQTLYGGGGTDIIFGEDGGVYTIDAGAGADIVTFSGPINADGQLDGGIGSDTLVLAGTIDINVVNFSPAADAFERVYLEGSVTLQGDFENNVIDMSGTPVGPFEGGGDLSIRGGDGNDTLTGSNGFEFIYGGAGDNTLTGNGGGDFLDVSDSFGTNTVYGGTGGDTIVAGNGLDTLYGGDGQDTFYGGLGEAAMYGGDDGDYFAADQGGHYLVDGGDGKDVVWFNGAITVANQLQGGADYDKLHLDDDITVNGAGTFEPGAQGFEHVFVLFGTQITGGELADTVDLSGTKVSVEVFARNARFSAESPYAVIIDGNSGDDSLTGSNLRDAIYGGSGSNTLAGGDRGDLLDVSDSSGVNTLTGGAGNDRLIGGLGSDTLYGGADNDVIEANHGGRYTVAAGTGDDVVYFAGGFDSAGQLAGGSGTDTLVLGNAVSVSATLFAPAGQGFENVTIALHTSIGIANPATVDFSGVTVDSSRSDAVLTITGSNGTDTLTGSNWTDHIDAGTGNDTVDGGADGDDVLDGGAGLNRISFAHSSAGVDVSLAETVAQDVGGGRMMTIDNFRFVTGSAFGDTVTGDDFGNVIDGGAGNDTLIGGLGADTLTGGLGADTFTFLALADSRVNAGNRDIIDFHRGQGDLLDVSAIDADTTQGSDQAFHLVQGGKFSGTPGELIYFSENGHTVISGDVNGDFFADFEFQLTTNINMVTADFVL